MELPYMILHFLCLCIKSDCAIFSSAVLISCEVCGDSDLLFILLGEDAGKTEKCCVPIHR